MFLESKGVIHQPLEKVYLLVRDQITELVPHLPNIEKIECIERKTLADGTLEQLNHWYAKADIPSFAKKYVRPEVFGWKDFARWPKPKPNDQMHSVDFRLESFVGKSLYDARGTNYFTALDAGRTELRLTCEITIHAENIPGVPKFLVRQYLPRVEGFLGRILEPNLANLAQGLNHYFASKN